MFSEFWGNLATGSLNLLPNADGVATVTGSAAIDGVLTLPSYILRTLSGGAWIFGS